MPPVIALKNASCWARIVSNPGMDAMGLIAVMFSTIFDCPCLSISKLMVRKSGTTDCACVE
jgi:hypothetical protein